MLTRVLTRSIAAVAALLLIAPAVVGSAQRGPQRAAPVDAGHPIMQPEQAAEGGPVFGDPSKPGIYITRNRFAAGQTSRPHVHDQDRWLTIIKGTYWVGEGDVYDPAKMTPVKEGGVMFHPAGFHHFDGSRGDEVIVQITGMGPVRTTSTEVDGNGNPVSGRGARGTPRPGR